MTATNHALTGALIATFIKEPVAAVPAAFAAHFLMDAIPHFGLKFEDAVFKPYSKRFRLTLLLDVALAGLLLLTVPILLALSHNPWLVFACMFACMSPDLVWGYRFFHELRERTERAKNWFSRFHSFIQWSETPPGLVVEIAWFAAVFIALMLRA